MPRRLALAVAPLAALAAGEPADAQVACRQGLVLAIDVSASVDPREYRLQSDGLAWALRDVEVRQAFLLRPEAPVWLAVFEWSGATYQRIVVGWTAVTDESVLDRVAGMIEANPAPPEQTTTGIGAAMIFAAGLIAEGPPCASWTIDISGDGQNNDWPRPEEARNDPRLAGVTINGLVIGADFPIDHALNPNRMGALTAYYRNRVIRGPGAFVETADDFRDFGPTMRRKLIRELASMIVGDARPTGAPGVPGAPGGAPVARN
ncbi:MAG: DUF1194 domain-containing protein [Rhodobacteraceae bacterium]|nr:DUF1194 domain-containing protein [Paracoccaceae bacterium]